MNKKNCGGQNLKKWVRHTNVSILKNVNPIKNHKNIYKTQECDETNIKHCV